MATLYDVTSSGGRRGILQKLASRACLHRCIILTVDTEEKASGSGAYCAAEPRNRNMYENIIKFITAPPHNIKIASASILLSVLAIAFYFFCKKRNKQGVWHFASLQNASNPNSNPFNCEPPVRESNTRQKKTLFEEDHQVILKKLMESLKLLPSRKLYYMSKTQNVEIV